MLDIETTDGRPADAVRGWTAAFLRAMTALGLPCGVYTYPGFAANLPTTPAIAARPLWIAHVGAGGAPRAKSPTIPPPWRQAAFWQYTWRGRVDGVSGAVDLDRLLTPCDPLGCYRLPAA